MTASSNVVVPRFHAAVPALEKMARRATTTSKFSRLHGLQPSSSARPVAPISSRPSHSGSPQSYATISTQPEPQRQQRQRQPPLTIPYPSTTAHQSRSIVPPTLSEIQARLPRTRSSTRPKFLLGTVSHVGTMSKTVQISQRKQGFDGWLKRYTQHTERVRAHEPSGYLRKGDVVEFARFSPATMAQRYESGKLDRRWGGVRFEVHRVVTPFGEPVRARAELPKEGELWDRFGDVEFERRRYELTRSWNREDGKRRIGLLEGMCDAVQMEVERMSEQVSGDLARAAMSEQVEQQQRRQQMDRIDAARSPQGQFEGPSDAPRDTAAQL